MLSHCSSRKRKRQHIPWHSSISLPVPNIPLTLCTDFNQQKKAPMKLTLLATLTCLTATLAHAADVAFPPPSPVSIGDSWTYKKTVKTAHNQLKSFINYKITGTAGEDKLVYQSMLADASVRAPMKWRDAGKVDADACLIDFGPGGSLGLQKTCAITFVEGMDWDTDEAVDGTRTKRRYKVMGTENISVPAGTFDTTKIQADWQVIKSGGGKGKQNAYGPTERFRFIYWYSPITKGMVKVVREFYDDVGTVESTVTEELDTHRPIKRD